MGPGLTLGAWKKAIRKLLGIASSLVAMHGSAAVLYVDVNSPSPAPPFASWESAAAAIQDAIDAASPGDQILVTNGTYQTGGLAIYGSLTNRVAVTKPVMLKSVNGPSVTFIQGYQVPGTTNGEGAVRCVYLTNNAALIGFTLEGGATRLTNSADAVRERSGGGIWCETNDPALVSNCTLVFNSAARVGGGAYYGNLINCTLDNNRANIGGAAYMGVLSNCFLFFNSASDGGATSLSTLNGCTLVYNSAGYGGGAFYGTLTNCTLSVNSASEGGGAYGANLIGCILSTNTALDGGGAYGGTLNNCSLLRNTAQTSGAGGGADFATLNNCILVGNSASQGGGAGNGYLNNCTIVSNSASSGGGTLTCTLQNCIVYYNNTPLFDPNFYGTTLYNSCTTPMPNYGARNITNAPVFADLGAGNLRLQSNSPCINAGFNGYAVGTTDLDGNPRIIGGTVDIGAYEFQAPTSVISYAWLQQYGLPTDGTADYVDSDGDQMNNWQEWIAGTDPEDPTSVLRILTLSTRTGAVDVTWQSIAYRIYSLHRGSDLASQSSFQIIASNVVGQAVMTTYSDTNAIGTGPFFYRISVQP